MYQIKDENVEKIKKEILEAKANVSFINRQERLTGSDVCARDYSQGIVNALEWVLGDRKKNPMDENDKD